MGIEIVDAPQPRHYSWQLLLELPQGKAIRTTYNSLADAELARAGAQSFARYHGIKAITSVKFEPTPDSVYALYVWQ